MINPANITIHVVRDRNSNGADYFVWGWNDPEGAAVSLQQAVEDCGAENVEHLVLNCATACRAELRRWHELAVGEVPPMMSDKELRDVCASHATYAHGNF
jgi:hypothetical protein